MDKIYQSLTLDEAIDSFMGIIDTPIFKRKCKSVINMLDGSDDISTVISIVTTVLREYFDGNIDLCDDLKGCIYNILYNYNAFAYCKILDILENELDR